MMCDMLQSGGLVRFPAFRQYEQLRVEASNALMGLLAGAQLSNHLLQLNRGSDRLLPEVYPNVPHIRRFNLTAEAASDILSEADVHLGAMSIAYALALHEDHVRTSLHMLADAGLVSRRRAREAHAAGQHGLLQDACGTRLDPLPLEQLGVLRRMRNSVIHDGGRVSAGLVTSIGAMSHAALAAWTKIAKNDPSKLLEGDRLRLGHGEMLLALATTKSIERGINRLLQIGLPRSEWIEIAVTDAVASLPGVVKGNAPGRKVHGFARHHYGPLEITRAEVDDELRTR
jgi:hypothetical protein